MICPGTRPVQTPHPYEHMPTLDLSSNDERKRPPVCAFAICSQKVGPAAESTFPRKVFVGCKSEVSYATETEKIAHPIQDKFKCEDRHSPSQIFPSHLKRINMVSTRRYLLTIEARPSC